ncbi:hypothetical protein CIPAW_12G079200 [Carya illinoinensis]|uniref:Uncharacterized protein n=1 Tax=Carya illinoinensis TaxID=32201 RepID=A0A8T1NUP5_CARIL|nr:hypothetical protein CIPAW_12G079200 [Carya illinoinensis]
MLLTHILAGFLIYFPGYFGGLENPRVSLLDRHVLMLLESWRYAQ